MIRDSEIPCGFNPAVPARLTPAILRQVADTLAALAPDVVLVKNALGNLAIIATDDGSFVGWVDMRIGEVTVHGEVVFEGVS